MATPRSRRAARHRARRRRAQHRARRLAVIGIVAALALVTLILTAFGSGSPGTVSTTITPPVAVGVQPEPDVLATVGNLQIKLPVAGGAVTAIGFHGAGAGALELSPVGRQLNEGVLARLWRRIAGSSQGRTGLDPARGRAGHRGARGRRDARHGRLLPGRRHGRLDLRLRARREEVRRPGST